jgi:hypothetical protein
MSVYALSRAVSIRGSFQRASSSELRAVLVLKEGFPVRLTANAIRLIADAGITGPFYAAEPSHNSLGIPVSG